MRIVFDTWQFVRVMVRLEKTRNQDRDRKALWTAWSDDWPTVDGELETLRQNNFRAFATAMMDQEVTFDPVDAQTVSTVAALSEEVIQELKRALKGAKGDARDDLEFELASMTEFSGRMSELSVGAAS